MPSPVSIVVSSFVVRAFDVLMPCADDKSRECSERERRAIAALAYTRRRRPSHISAASPRSARRSQHRTPIVRHRASPVQHGTLTRAPRSTVAQSMRRRRHASAMPLLRHHARSGRALIWKPRTASHRPYLRCRAPHAQPGGPHAPHGGLGLHACAAPSTPRGGPPRCPPSRRRLRLELGHLARDGRLDLRRGAEGPLREDGEGDGSPEAEGAVEGGAGRGACEPGTEACP